MKKLKPAKKLNLERIRIANLSNVKGGYKETEASNASTCVASCGECSAITCRGQMSCASDPHHCEADA